MANSFRKRVSEALRLKYILYTATVVGLVLVATYVQFFINPFEIGIVRSSNFSWEEFENVKEGQSIEEVIELLGMPIREPELLTIINPGVEAGDPCSSSPCKTYRFYGRSNGFLPAAGYREAIIVAGSDGRVVGIIVREE